MEIQCGNCGTRFNLDESLLKRAGSKVRCSLCKHVFTAYPTQPEKVEAPGPQVPEQEGRGILPEEALPGATQELAAAEHGGEPDLDRLPEEGRRGIEKTGGGTEREEEEVEEPVADMTAAALGPSVDEEIRAFPTEEGEAAAIRKKPGKKRFWILFLLVVLIGAGVAAAVYYLKPAAEKRVPDAGVRRLSFEAVSGSFVESKEAGVLFVIRGKVRNNYPESRSLLRVKANVLDDRGQVVRQKTAYAGSVYQDEEIRVLPMPEITKAMNNRKGMAAENMKLPPGAAIGFMIVFENLPENLSEFTVEAVSSSPAMP